MRESSVEAVLASEVRTAGGMSIKMLAVTAGTPDRLVLMPGGRLYLVELKTKTGRLRPIQRVWHSRAADLGTEVVVLHGAEEVKEWVRSLVQ